MSRQNCHSEPGRSGRDERGLRFVPDGNRALGGPGQRRDAGTKEKIAAGRRRPARSLQPRGDALASVLKFSLFIFSNFPSSLRPRTQKSQLPWVVEGTQPSSRQRPAFVPEASTNEDLRVPGIRRRQAASLQPPSPMHAQRRAACEVQVRFLPWASNRVAPVEARQVSTTLTRLLPLYRVESNNYLAAIATKLPPALTLVWTVMPDRLCLYIRPHPAARSAQQQEALSSWAEAAGHTIVATFTEPERKRGADHRREASRMLAGAPNGLWDRVAAVSLLSLCRSVQHADSILAQLAAVGVHLTTLADGIDTATDDGRTAAGFALAGQLDHDLHAERAFTGVRKRAAAGFPVGRPRVPATTEARIAALVRAGTSTERITRLVGCGKSTVYRVREELKLAAEVPS